MMEKLEALRGLEIEMDALKSLLAKLQNIKPDQATDSDIADWIMKNGRSFESLLAKVPTEHRQDTVKERTLSSKSDDISI